MKLPTLVLGATLFLNALTIAAPTPDFSAAQTTWKDVRTGLQDLDSLIVQKKLSAVHEAAFSLRDSVRELRFGDDALAPDAKTRLDTLIRQLDTLANALDSSGDKNDLRGTIHSQRQAHLLLDQIAATFPTGTLPQLGPVTSNTPIKDPVCRMTVVPAVTPGQAVYGGQTYYFCSKADTNTFKKNPAKYAALYEDIAFGKPKTYSLSFDQKGPALAKKQTTLAFAVREQGSAAIVKKFQLVHEKLLHLIVVRDDLSYFSHEHPEISPDGRFYLRTTFPTGGRYLLFGDCTPSDGLNQILATSITIAGTRPVAPKLVVDQTLTKTIDGLTITLHPSGPLEVGKPTLLTYALSQNGKLVTDMEPYLGAMGHLMAINQNGRNILHTHTVSSGGDVTSAMATASGPRFTYEVELAKSGLTKIWAQFQRHGRVITVPFVFDVKPTMKTTPKILTTLATGAALAAPSFAAPAPKIPANAQKITVTLPEGYSASTQSVKAGRPVALTFFLKSEAGCGNEITVPAAHWKKTLKIGEKATLVYTPKKSGTLAFACSMDEMKGSIIVK